MRQMITTRLRPMLEPYQPALHHPKGGYTLTRGGSTRRLSINLHYTNQRWLLMHRSPVGA